MTFIDTITDKTNTDIVVSDAKGDQEARDDLRVGFGSVQKRDHVVAGIVGSDDKTPTSAPRDMATSFQFLHQAVSLKIRVSECPNLHQHGIFCTEMKRYTLD